jgi:16S rRNA (guanine527-N7)-methyltransferase
VDFSLPRSAIEQLAGELSESQAHSLALYADAILRASPRMNLVSRRSLGDLEGHLVDAAALLAFADPGDGQVADLGSGAGLPGLVVAILRPRARVTVVDSRRSKVVFLKDVVRRLRLPNVEVVHARIENLAGRVAYPLAVARALGESSVILPGCLRLLAPGGRLVLFKGPRWVDEAADVRAIAEEQGAEITRAEQVPLPGVGRATTFVEFHVKR